jgi:hypothetical protein
MDIKRFFSRTEVLRYPPLNLTEDELRKRLEDVDEELAKQMIDSWKVNRDFLLTCSDQLVLVLPSVGPKNEELDAWCAENTRSTWGHLQMIRYWWFDDSTDAMTFKLTWCD